MKNKQQIPPHTKIWLFIPQPFLQEFDTQTKHTYTSRNEAIRTGMKLITKQTKHHHKQPTPQTLGDNK